MEKEQGNKIGKAGQLGCGLSHAGALTSELLLSDSSGCARTQGCLSAQRLVWPVSVGMFSCTRQSSLHSLDACWLAGAERKWPGAREEREGVTAEKHLTTANRATTNLGLWLHLGSL